MTYQLKVAAVAFALASVGFANADTTFMDQIGSNPADMTGSLNASQYFTDAGFSQYNTATGDDFTIGTAGTVHEVDTFGGFWNTATPNFANITNWEVDIYSSVAAAGNNLVGDVASVSLPSNSAQVSVNTAYDSAISGSGLVSISGLNLNLAAGTYYVAVIATMNFAQGGQFGIAQSTWAGNNPGGLNGFQANPGGALLGANTGTTGADAALRVIGAPAAVPEPVSMTFLGVGVVGLIARRRKQS